MNLKHIKGEPSALAPGVFSSFAIRSLALATGLLLTIVTSDAFAGAVANFDDIEFWVGSGESQAALVLDWQGNATLDNSLAWGYRFDGTPKTLDMVTAIVAADDRLFARIGPVSGFGLAVFGLGYDANNDGEFALTDGTAFDPDGIAISEITDGTESVDAADFYYEGWFVDGYWHYGVATGNPYNGGTWARSGSGISSHDVLADSWHSLAFTPTFSNQAFARNPIAAELSGSADFDGDGDVDGRDFLSWQRGGSPTLLSPSDLAFWSEQYGMNTLSGFTSSAALVVPEPRWLGSLCVAVGAWSAVFLRFRIASRRMIS